MCQKINFDWISKLATAVNSDKELTAVGDNFTTDFVIVFGEKSCLCCPCEVNHRM